MKQMSVEINVVFLCFPQNLQVDWQPIKTQVKRTEYNIFRHGDVIN